MDVKLSFLSDIVTRNCPDHYWSINKNESPVNFFISFSVKLELFQRVVSRMAVGTKLQESPIPALERPQTSLVAQFQKQTNNTTTETLTHWHFFANVRKLAYVKYWLKKLRFCLSWFPIHVHLFQGCRNLQTFGEHKKSLCCVLPYFKVRLINKRWCKMRIYDINL